MAIEGGKVVIHAVHERDAEEFWKKLELKEVDEYLYHEDDRGDIFSAGKNQGVVKIIEELLGNQNNG